MTNESCPICHGFGTATTCSDCGGIGTEAAYTERLMKPIPIKAARTLGQESGAQRIVIFALKSGAYNITTWGKTRRDCEALRRWAETDRAEEVVQSVADAPNRLSFLESQMLTALKSAYDYLERVRGTEEGCGTWLFDVAEEALRDAISKAEGGEYFEGKSR